MGTNAERNVERATKNNRETISSEESQSHMEESQLKPYAVLLLLLSWNDTLRAER